MCLTHWRTVPKSIQQAVWATYRPGQCDDMAPSEAWYHAADAAIGYVARLDGQPVRSSEVEELAALGFKEEGAQMILPVIDPLTLDSIFPKPGRNDPCHCGSGAKYKRCHETADQKAWRVVAQLRKEAENVGATLPRFNRPELEL